MILTRTPFRVTLGGGGTDLPSYYEKHGGFLFAMGLDLHMYVSILAPQLDRRLRVQYTKTEIVTHPRQLRHELVREALQRYEIFSRLEVSSIADLPAGAGLGSSGAYLVGLLHALRAYRGLDCSPAVLAAEACDLQIDVLRLPAGKQDPYLAAFGGITVLEIARDGTVAVRPVLVDRSTLPDLLANTHLYYTGVRRSDPDVLRDQDVAMRHEASARHAVVVEALRQIEDVGRRSLAAIEAGNYDEFGRLMDEHWHHKARLSPRVSIPGVQQLYQEVRRRFGVLGGKVAGAGGGGFFAVYAPRAHDELAAFMAQHGLVRLDYGIDFEGTRLLCPPDPGGATLDHAEIID